MYQFKVLFRIHKLQDSCENLKSIWPNFFFRKSNKGLLINCNNVMVPITNPINAFLVYYADYYPRAFHSFRFTSNLVTQGAEHTQVLYETKGRVEIELRCFLLGNLFYVFKFKYHFPLFFLYFGTGNIGHRSCSFSRVSSFISINK